MKKNTIDLPPERGGEGERQKAYRAFLRQCREEMRETVDSLPADRPWRVELGCGHGHFLVDQATRGQEFCWVGIDVNRGRIEASRKKADRMGLDHLYFLHGDIRLFMEAVSVERVSEVYVLFPDPFPKARHEKHRLFQDTFLDQLTRILSPDGKLYFKTDVGAYFREVEEKMNLRPEYRRLPLDWPEGIPTVFEQRAEQVLAAIWEKKPV